MDNFYLNLILINDEKEKLIKFLEENNMIYTQYNSAYRAYLVEEAENYLYNNLYDCCEPDQLERYILQYKEQLAEEYMSSCDGCWDDLTEGLYEVTSDFCYEYIEEYKEMME